MGPVEQQVTAALHEALQGSAIVLDTGIFGQLAAIAAPSTEVAADPAVEMLMRLSTGMLHAVVHLAQEIDRINGNTP